MGASANQIQIITLSITRMGSGRHHASPTRLVNGDSPSQRSPGDRPGPARMPSSCRGDLENLNGCGAAKGVRGELRLSVTCHLSTVAPRASHTQISVCIRFCEGGGDECTFKLLLWLFLLR